MKNPRVALLALGLLCLVASMAYAQTPPPPPEAKAIAISSENDGDMNRRIEIKKEDGRSLVKIWETQDGQDVLVEEFEAGNEAELKEKLDDYDIYFLGDDDDLVHAKGKAGKHFKKLKIDGKHPRMAYFSGPKTWLGVGMTDLNEQLGEYFEVEDGKGTLVNEVIKDSPAEKAGLKAGDVIIKLDDHDVADAGDIATYVGDRNPGDKIEVTVRRKGKTKTFKAELAEREADSYSLRGDGDEEMIWNMREPGKLDRYRMAPGPQHEILMKRLHEDTGTEEKIEEMRADIAELKAMLEELRNAQK